MLLSTGSTVPGEPEWRQSPGLVPYADALAVMEERVAAIGVGAAPELIWLLEHPPLLTAGTSADIADVRRPGDLPLHWTGRGGKITYHGPGQRVLYVLLNLARRGHDVRAHVRRLEAWGIAALAELGVQAWRCHEQPGIWVGGDQPGKIAAVGVRVRRWISYHGLAINVDVDPEGFGAIRPCGLDLPVAQLRSTTTRATMADLDATLWTHRGQLLGSPDTST